VAVDGIAGGFLSNGRLAVLLELADDLLADEGAQRGGAAEDVGTGVVDGGEHKGRGVDRGDGVGEEGGTGTLRCRGSSTRGCLRGGIFSYARGIRNESAWIEVGDVQIGVVKTAREIGLSGGLVWSLGERRSTDEKDEQ
jgi:hypothetical protein